MILLFTGGSRAQIPTLMQFPAFPNKSDIDLVDSEGQGRGVQTPFSNTLVSPKYSQVSYLGELFSPKYSTWERVDFETAKSSPKYSQV